MLLHSALALAGIAAIVVALWFTLWTGWAARRVTGRLSIGFIVLGIGSVIAFGVATQPLIGAPPEGDAAFGYFVRVSRTTPLWFALGAGSLLTMGVWMLLLVRRTYHGGSKAAEGAGRSAIQVLLVAGTVVFGIPFVWLLSTSFKEEIDMAHLPPIWIPKVKQYISQPENPRAVLVEGTYDGRAYRGAAIQEFSTGRRKIRILDPPSLAGIVYLARAGDTNDFRKPGLRWENYARAIREMPKETLHGAIYLLNTLLLVALNITGAILASALVGFAFARLRFPGRNGIFLLLLATVMLPGAVTLMPVFLIFRALGWVDTLYPLWVPAFFGGAFNIFLMRQFFLTVPTELDEAARIDGCGYFRIFSDIMLPLVKPALAAIAIWTFTATWNNFMGPLIYINSPEKMPVSYALQLFQSTHGGDPGALMAATVMVMLPVVMVFFFAQKYFIEGVTLTGLGGR